MEVWAQPFRIEDDLSSLETDSVGCDFCNMRWKVCLRLNFQSRTQICFDRLGSTIRVNERYPPVFTVSQDPESRNQTPVPHLQIGIPQITGTGNPLQFRILRQFLIDCDQQHPGCKQTREFSLPKRLIDVGSEVKPRIRLHETSPSESMEYLALSHPWGSPPHFCTFVNNLSVHHRDITFYDLPATFKDAIKVTRNLGLRYLWIDSICIVQGPDGDFAEQAEQMETIFSQAYCVIAASSATSQQDGFLHPRRMRDVVHFEANNRTAIHIGEFMDNFDQNVLQSPLNQRGWVLQERALARRTIYFTAEQTFMECGAGVRCETMTRMNNTLASFLGDPAFPKVAIESSRGGKIRLYQDLYSRYSRLGLSHQQDRPIAIAGLEKRLIESLGVHGAFGVLDDGNHGLLRRSLLWCRGSDQQSLKRLDFHDTERQQTPRGVPHPPSWSWMAYQGGIDYLDLPFDKVDWDEHDILSPWSSYQPGTRHSTDSGERTVPGLSVIARKFDIQAVQRKDSMLIYDTPSGSAEPPPGLKCVIMGRMRSALRPEHERLHYVMIVGPRFSGAGASSKTVYERVGVGYMPGWLIHEDGPAPMEMIH